MALYFNLNNNETSKELLINKFNMILDNQGGLVLNDQSITSPHRTTEVSCVCSEAATGGVLKGMLRRNIEHFLKGRIYEKLGFSEMN